ncbi:hypothetical protein T265_10562 [Opisthorchis viverrini]|uniref:Uncharacterized protein n=1 Tax=Opisthorchis viverrini TaxID=6198 RepID=A0A074Z1T8_OPIVI|nr:hypothetical protein T265_10562 [Opisthorchis viverrini]KER21011.1 hypothetical protein T265_10562 [Opisthorchis viverrini]
MTTVVNMVSLNDASQPMYCSPVTSQNAATDFTAPPVEFVCTAYDDWTWIAYNTQFVRINNSSTTNGVMHKNAQLGRLNTANAQLGGHLGLQSRRKNNDKRLL